MFVRIQGQLVHTASFGSGHRVIVGIPGSFGTCEIWEQPFELLSANHRTVTFDHFGAGETHVPDELVTFDEQIRLVVEVLDTLDVERCVLAGDSSMGTVAVEAAMRNPDRIEGLVLVSAGMSYAPDDGVRRFVAGLRTDPVKTLEFFVHLCLPEDEDGHLRRWLTDIIVRTGPERAARLVEAFYQVDVRERMRHLATPTLIIHGELDALLASSLETAREMADLIHGATLVVLDGVGHVPTLSRPREVAAAIETFVGRLPR
ncbi:MAG TPA: alpha/beta hydrolase [Acidimicrobiales bacterium]|nr:alpha/beta hydrolase [Acidimicrobiales bacterium]